jgi:murein DD-endopeptidase MepM/ murein hydrolase activator NlpD
MNIILFNNKRGQILNLELNIVLLGVVFALVLAVVLGTSMYAGHRLDSDNMDHVADWQQILDEQQVLITRAREDAQIDLDALTFRLGQMQAQLMRVNALGERLVNQADFDTAEFDFDQPPAMGGPHEVVAAESINVQDFMAMLEEVSSGLEDRERKLAMLEIFMQNKNLRSRLTPSGRPIKSGWLSSKFGRRTDPFSGKQEYHKGVDFAGKEGSDVIAVGDGVVSWAGERFGYGNLIEITHGNGYVTRYGHNREYLVTEGDKVSKGQVIALMGSTGRSTGPHVHFEVLKNNRQVNPAKFLAR